MAAFSPERGDIVWLDFDPQSGHEQAGRRPALTLSPKEYNQKVGLALFCPLSNQAKGYPFEVRVPAGLKASGVVLSDQVRNLDWRARRASLIGRAPPEVTAEVLEKISLLLGGEHAD